MVKKLAKPKPKQKPKQKQTQRQRQSVVVNVSLPKSTRAVKRTPRKGVSGGSGGGFVGGVNYVYSPSETTPIIRNVETPQLPPLMIKDTQQLSLPTELKPSPFPAITYPMPTELQSSSEDKRPFLPKSLQQEFYDDSDEFIEENPMRIPIQSKAKVIDVSQLSPAEKAIHDESIRKRNITPPPQKKQRANLTGYTKQEKALHTSVLLDIRDAKSEDIGALKPPSQKVIHQRIQRANKLELVERRITEREN